ncbi:apolipoprotein C-I [Siniperca chuatsi]|uniref:apolipoprotein C-I n=1 Tax=Siniperca chuatsi TaxID=119488 RepID=UPI001CE1F8A8|nr:apolipoprotein C-I [Siniperca chuatsi]
MDGGRDTSRSPRVHVDLVFCVTLINPSRLIKRNTHQHSNKVDFFFSSETENRVTAKMRLYLALAVLMLAFVAYTEAQEETIEAKFTKFGEQMSEMTRTLADKAKVTFEQIHTSDFAVNTRNWLQEQVEKLKTKFVENSK